MTKRKLNNSIAFLTRAALLVLALSFSLFAQGKNPLILDSKEPTLPLEKFAYNETRYSMLLKSNEERAETLMDLAKKDVQERWQHYRQRASVPSHESEKEEDDRA